MLLNYTLTLKVLYPRRIVALTVRNVVWALWGEYPGDFKEAVTNLENKWPIVFPNVSLDAVNDLLQYLANVAPEKKMIAEKIVSDAITYAKSMVCGNNSELS